MNRVYPQDRQTTSGRSAGVEHLREDHYRTLVRESAISPAVAAERGYWTATGRGQLRTFKGYQRRAPALVVPMHSPDGCMVSAQIRPDRPRRNHRKHTEVIKYETPGGAAPILDVHPRNHAGMADTGRTLYITEGVKKGDALTSKGLCAVALAGVWMWRVPKTREMLPCWQHVALVGRDVRIVYDSDVMTKPDVQRALAELVSDLEDQGAAVQVIYLPGAADGTKQGVDDYISAGGTVRELEMLARPFEPVHVADMRLAADTALRDRIGALWATWRNMPSATTGENTRRAVLRALVEHAELRGEAVEDGVRVQIDRRTLAERAASTKSSVNRAAAQLEAGGWIYRVAPATREEAGAFVLVGLPDTGASVSSTGRALADQDRGETGEGQKGRDSTGEAYDHRGPVARAPQNPHGNAECDRGGPVVRAPVRDIPALRWSYVARYRTHADEPYQYEFCARLGKRREHIVRYLAESGGEASVAELLERFGGKRTRPRDFRRRALDALTDPAVIELDGDTVRLSDNWREALEHARAEGDELEASRRQHRQHQYQREAYRTRDQHPADPSPTQADMDRARGERERRAQDDRERPVSPLAAAMRSYLERNPHDAHQPAGWLGSTVYWCEGFDHLPTPAESKAALAELGGDSYLERLTRGAVA